MLLSRLYDINYSNCGDAKLWKKFYILIRLRQQLHIQYKYYIYDTAIKHIIQLLHI